MRRLLSLALCAGALLAGGCKKTGEPPHVPSIPSVVLAGEFFAQDETGGLMPSGIAAQCTGVHAYLNADPFASYSVAEICRTVPSDGEEPVALVHVFSFDDGTDYWAHEDMVVLNASPVVLLEAKPACFSLTDDPEQFAQADAVIPAQTIVAVHHNGMMLDYLQVSWLDGGAVQTGFIENPHPFFSTNGNDAQAVRLYQDAAALGDDEKEAKKSILDRALALDGLSSQVRGMIQNARTALNPPPAKPAGAYVRLRAPDVRSVRSGSRYGVNMGELLKGGTEDPWAKGN